MTYSIAATRHILGHSIQALHQVQYSGTDTALYGQSIIGHLLVGEGLPGLLRGLLGLIELVSSHNG